MNEIWDLITRGRRPRPPKPPPGPPPLPVPPPPIPEPVPPQPTLGGFVLPAADASARPRLSREEIAAFLPRRGGFTFPPPYHTVGVRLTNEEDGAIEPMGYSYWRRINAHAGQLDLMVILGRTAAPALLLAVDKTTHKVLAGPLEELSGTGEQWYFSARHPYRLFVPDGPRLRTFDVATHAWDLVFEVDANSYLWQVHSSDDEQVHSATLRDRDSGRALGALVRRTDGGTTIFPVPSGGVLDECQIDRSGRYLLIKEAPDTASAIHNRVVDLVSGQEMTLPATAGAVGHSDMGYGYCVGENANTPGALPGGFIRMNLAAPSLQSLVYHMHGWEPPMTRHVSHTNAPQARVLFSSASRDDRPRANELVVAPLDGSLMCTVIAPTLVDLDAPGGGDDYRKMPKANLDPAGEWAVWTANCGTDRLDAFLVRLP